MQSQEPRKSVYFQKKALYNTSNRFIAFHDVLKLLKEKHLIMSTLDFSREPLLTLNKDGISDELFKLLWSKDEMNFSPLINIPDTIIYKYGQPTAWYFTSNNGHIKKKNKFNLVSSKIEDAFNRHPLGYDVIAYFITMPNEYELTHNNNGNNTTTNANTPTMIEYLDRDGLNKFLYNHKKEVNGILQKFIEPKTTHNEVIRAIWSPKLILLEKAENIHELHDKRYGLYEKCVLYEGPDYYYQTSPLRGPVMSGQIQKLVETSIAHINEVTFGQKQISRIVLTFKLDSREKLWLLYSTSIRCIDMMELKPLGADDPNTTTNSATSSVNVRNLLNIDNVITLPEKVSLNPFKSYSFTKESKLPTKQRIACISCTTETLQELRHPITYKSIIKHYDHVLHLLQSSISLKHHNRKEGTIAWPPDREIVEAAGGVGFCGLLNFQKLGSTGLPDTANNDNNSYNSSIRRNSNKEETTYKPRRRNDNIRYKSIKDVQIPPIIISLHPKLTTDTYERCKNDPLFYNKTIHVCESCYLVYAEFTTMLLQLGDNIHKLLSSDSSNNNNLTGTTRAKMNNPFLPQGGATGGGGITGNGMGGRPTSADWRAISQSVNNSNNVNASSSLFQGSLLSSSLSDMALQHHYDAKQRSIGLRSDDQREHPLLPNAVRSATDTAGLPLPSLHHHTPLPHEASVSIVSPATSTYYHAGGMLEDSNSLFSPSLHKGSGGAGTGGVGGGVFAYDSEEVKSMIADRERRFFKEISLNPQLKDSHPLQHLISTQQKLKLINEQSGILMSNKKATTTTPLFNDSQYGKQSHTIKPLKYAPYATELPYTVNGEIVLPSELRKKKLGDAKLKKLQKQRTLQSFLSGQLPNENDHNEDHDYNYNMMKSETTPDLTKILKVVEQHTSKAHTASTGMLPNTTTTTLNNTTQKKDPIDQNIKNSKQYRSFLSESLKRIEDDVQDVNFDTSPKSRHRSSSNNNSNNNSPNRSATTRMKMSATAPSPMNSTIGSTPLSRNTSSSKYPRKGGNSDSGSGNNSTASSNRTSPRDSLLNGKPKAIKDRAAGRLIEEIVEEEEREAKRAEGGKTAANDLISEIIDEEEIEGRRAEGGKEAATNLMKEITEEEEKEGKKAEGGKVAANHLIDEIHAEEEKEGKRALGGKDAATHLVEEVVNEEEREAKRAEGGKIAADNLLDEVNEEEEKEGKRAEGGKAAASHLLDEVIDEEEKEGKRAVGGKKAANQLLNEISREEGGDDDDLLFSPYSQSSFEPPTASFPNPSPPNPQVPSTTTAAQLEESDEYGLSESAIDPTTVSTTQPHDIASSFTNSVIDEAVKVVSRENSRPSTAVAPPPPLPEWNDMEVEDDTSLMMSPPGLSAQVSDSELLEAISDSIIKEAMEQQDDQSVVEEVVEES